MSLIFTLLWSEPAQAARVAAGLDASGWQAVDRQAGQHRLRALLHWRAVAGGWSIPAELARDWQASHQRSARRALAQKAALARVGRCLGQGGVSAAVLKGGAFVWTATIDPAIRPMRDLDVLIRPEDADRAMALLRANGFAYDRQSQPSGKHLPALTDGKAVVELHLHIFDTHDDAAAAREAEFIARAWARRAVGPVPGMDALSPTDTLLHLILHAVLDHQFNNGPLLLVDMPALARPGAIDWALLWQEAAQLGTIRACQLALALGERVCGLAVDWQGHAPTDLSDHELDLTLRLMLVDTEYRSAIGWPGRLLRIPPHRWPAQVGDMIRRRARGAAGAGNRAPSVEPGLAASLSYAVGAEGRARIADAVRLSRWLQR